MGTILYRATKPQAVLDELTDVGTRSSVLAYRVIGNRLWFVAQTHAGERAGRKWIGLTLIDSRHGDVAIKSMDKTCGPCYYDCPLSFLAQADEPMGSYAGPWREKVRAFHAGKAAKRIRSALARASRMAETPTCCGALSGAAAGRSAAKATATSTA